MNDFRENPPKSFGKFEIVEWTDYKTGEIVCTREKIRKRTELPIANVLYYKLSNDAWCCVRPSGTEPKIKYYIGVKGTSFGDSNKQIEELENAIKKM